MPLTVLWHVNDKKTVSNWMQRLWTGRQHLRWIINSGTALNLLLPSSNFAEISQWTLGPLARNFKILVSAQNIKPQLFRCLQNEVILAEHPSFKSKEVLEFFWDLISNHCFGFWDYFGFDLQPNGRCMELVLLNPTKAADPRFSEWICILTTKSRDSSISVGENHTTRWSLSCETIGGIDVRFEKRNLCVDCGCFLQFQNIWNRRCIKQSSSKKRFPMVHLNTYDSSSLKKRKCLSHIQNNNQKKSDINR